MEGETRWLSKHSSPILAVCTYCREKRDHDGGENDGFRSEVLSLWEYFDKGAFPLHAAACRCTLDGIGSPSQAPSQALLLPEC